MKAHLAFLPAPFVRTRTRHSSIDEVSQCSGLVNIFRFSDFRLALDLLITRHGTGGMLRIQRKANGEVVFTLSGRIDNEHIAELEALIGVEGKHRRIVLDLKDMTLTGQDGINFLAQCEAADMTLVNCDPYVREWINRQETERNAP